MLFYTCDRSGDLKTGQTLSAINAPQGNKVCSLLGLSSLSRHGARYCKDELFNFDEGGHDITPKAFGDAYIEIAFEIFRQNNRLALPSRLTCMFAWQSLKEAEEDIFQGDYPNKKIHQVSALKEYFIHDMNWLRYDSNSEKMNNFAAGYWSGKPMPSMTPIWEVLIPLPAKIGPVVL